MTTNPFAAPATASGIDWKDNIGRLLVIEPLSVETAVPTSLGDKDAVRANVHVIDGPAPQSYPDVLIFPRVLQGQLRTRIGEKVLGRLGQGQAKPGQSAPWVIQEASEADVAAGVAWLNARKSTEFAAPAATAPAATGQPPF